MSGEKREEALMELEVPAEVWLANEQVPLERLLNLHSGDVFRLERDPDGPAELVVNGTTVCYGELVIVDGNFGFRVTATTEDGLAEIEAAPAEAGPEPEAEPEADAEGEAE